MREKILRLREVVSYYTDKRFTTIAGTLAYSLLMSVAPFLVWLTLLLGSVDLSGVISNSLFESISPFLSYLKQSAQSAVGGAGIILLVTSLYSSTNFFYHLRRSGEIIFGTNKVKGGIKLRILSALLIIISILLFAVITAFAVAGRWLLTKILPVVACDIISAVFSAIIAFILVVLLNMFACPFKLTFSQAVKGSIITTVLWILFAAGFAVYIRFASPGKLYGAIASVIVFLLWCYFMMSCLVIGMIKNGALLTSKVHKKHL